MDNPGGDCYCAGDKPDKNPLKGWRFSPPCGLVLFLIMEFFWGQWLFVSLVVLSDLVELYLGLVWCGVDVMPSMDFSSTLRYISNP